MSQDTLSSLRMCLEDYLRQKGLSTKKAFRCLCPEHEDKHPSMVFQERTNRVHCFACGVSYDLFDLVGLDYGLDNFPQKLEKALQIFPEHEAVKIKPVHKPVLDLPEAVNQSDSPYMEKRGIPVALIRKYDIYEEGDRVYFPLVENGRKTAWCSRGISEEVKPRYKNSTGTLPLWNGDLLQRPGEGKLYITEGIIDALSLEAMGKQTLALCGCTRTEKLISMIKGTLHSRERQFVLCGDNDRAGQRMNQVLSRELKDLGISVTLLVPPEGKDWNQLYIEDKERLATLMEENGEAAEGSGTTEEDMPQCAASLLDGFFLQRERRREERAVSTGFSRLDKLLDGGMYPGFYVMGAVSSLGKTSLALQMADAIAAQGRDVLFLSLEQSSHELIAKSLSRLSVQYCGGGEAPLTQRQILGGGRSTTSAQERLLEICRTSYMDSGHHLFFQDGSSCGDVQALFELVEGHKGRQGQAPVVIVDYLQILGGIGSSLPDKQRVDQTVIQLKRLSREFDIPVLAVSSFNRENYRTAVSMEAFKESGAVEYSADVLLGLQFQGAGNKDFDVNVAKAAEPRQVELHILKNRSGLPYACMGLSFDARYSYFAETGKKLVAYA